MLKHYAKFGVEISKEWIELTIAKSIDEFSIMNHRKAKYYLTSDMNI